MPNQLTIYHCEFCELKFALFERFPDDLLPYCPNCSNDEDITLLGKGKMEIA